MPLNTYIILCLSYVACGERLGGETFLASLESSGWLKHIKCVLDTSYFIAKVCKPRHSYSSGRRGTKAIYSWLASIPKVLARIGSNSIDAKCSTVN